MEEKKRSVNYSRFQACIRNNVRNWNKTTLTDIEKYSVEMYIVWGIVDAALYILSLDDYQALKDWVLQEYGYNVGGANGVCEITQEQKARKEVRA